MLESHTAGTPPGVQTLHLCTEASNCLLGYCAFSGARSLAARLTEEIDVAFVAATPFTARTHATGHQYFANYV